MTADIISGGNLINQSVSKQRPALANHFFLSGRPPQALRRSVYAPVSLLHYSTGMHASTLSQNERLLHSIAAMLGRLLSAAVLSLSLPDEICSAAAASGSWRLIIAVNTPDDGPKRKRGKKKDR